MNIHSVAGVLLMMICHDMVNGCSSPPKPRPPPPGVRFSPAGGHDKKRAIRDHQERPAPKVIFTALDEDNDGNIDVCEWMEAGIMTSNVREFVGILDKVDKNDDNVLSFEEFETIQIQWGNGEMDINTRVEENHVG